MIGNPHINVNMEEGKVLAEYANNADGTPKDAFTASETPHTDAKGDKYIVKTHNDDEDAILAIGKIGDIYGGGNLATVEGDTYVDIGTGSWYNYETKQIETITRNAATITGNVYGGGKGEAAVTGADAFTCAKAMIGKVDSGKGSTNVIIGNGTVGTIENDILKAGTGNVYGGGEIGRVESNTSVTIGLEGNTENNITIMGNVYGAGQGVETHGYSGLTRGNSTVVVQGKAKVLGSVYGGGEMASVGAFWV